MQSFLGKINIVKCFVTDFSQISMPLQNMIKKKTIYKWWQDERTSFEFIKQTIIGAPSLSYPNYSKDIFLYTFSSDHLWEKKLTQKDI